MKSNSEKQKEDKQNIQNNLEGFDSKNTISESEKDSCGFWTKCMNIDRIGAVASSICAVHCLLTSIALGALSTLGLGFMESVWVDIFFVVLALSVGVFSVRHGYKHHASLLPPAIFFVGLTLVFVSHFIIGHDHHHHDHCECIHMEWVDVMAILGGVLLACFHFVNAKLMKSANQHVCCSSKKHHENKHIAL